jgi:plastocyanin
MLNDPLARRCGSLASARAALMVACLACVIVAINPAPAVYAYAPDPRVTIDNFAFSPETLTVPIGTIVTFENQDDMPHSIVATDKSIKSKALDTGDKFTVTLRRQAKSTISAGCIPA